MKVLKDLMENRKVNDGIVEAFIKKERFNRGDLIALKLIVDAYDRLDDENIQLAFTHMKWLVLCGKSEDVLNQENHEFSPNNFSPMLEKFGENYDKLRTQFEKILQQFPENAIVQDLLKDFNPVTKDNSSQNVGDTTVTNGLGCKSSASGAGVEYAKAKLPKIKQDISTELVSVRFEFELKEASKVSSKSLLSNVSRMLKILDVEGKFEKLIRELEEANEIVVTEVEAYEKCRFGKFKE